MMLSVAQNTWSVNNELKNMRKEATAAQFEVLSWHLLNGAEKKHEKPQSSHWPDI
jgi:hypothetical protein